jgi:hypothetical protein
MIFRVFGLVKWKGKKIANGVDGKFETKDERVINILRMKGFKEIEEDQTKPKIIINAKEKRVPKKHKKIS